MNPENHRNIPLTGLLILAATLVGCAENALDRGDTAFERHNYADALKHYQQAIASGQGDFDEDEELRSRYTTVRLEVLTKAIEKLASRPTATAVEVTAMRAEILKALNEPWITDRVKLKTLSGNYETWAAKALVAGLERTLRSPEDYAVRDALLAEALKAGAEPAGVERLQKMRPDAGGVAAATEGDLELARLRFAIAAESAPENYANFGEAGVMERRMAEARSVITEARRRVADADGALSLAQKAVRLWPKMPGATAFVEEQLALIRRAGDLREIIDAAVKTGDFPQVRHELAELLSIRSDAKTFGELELAWRKEIGRIDESGREAEAMLAATKALSELSNKGFGIPASSKSYYEDLKAGFLRKTEPRLIVAGKTGELGDLGGESADKTSAGSPLDFVVVADYSESAAVEIESRTPMSKVVVDFRNETNPSYADAKRSVSSAEFSYDNAKTRVSYARDQVQDAYKDTRNNPGNGEAQAKAERRQRDLKNSINDLDSQEATLRQAYAQLASTPQTIETRTQRVVNYAVGRAHGKGDATLTLTYPDSSKKFYEASFSRHDNFTESPSPEDGIPRDEIDITESEIRASLRRDILLKSTPTLRARLRDHAIAVHTASEKAAKDSRAALAHRIRLIWASGNMAEFHRLANEEPWTK